MSADTDIPDCSQPKSEYVDETVKDIDCHGTLSQIRVGFLFGRKYQHEQLDQKKRDQITADADKYAFDGTHIHICVRVSSIENLLIQTVMVLVSK